MERLTFLFSVYKKQTILFLISLLIVLIGCMAFFIINSKYNNVSNENIDILAEVEEKDNSIEKIPKIKSTIKVDIKGYVVNPGVYELESGSRVVDAINASGGLKENAYTRYINLSKILEDETVLIINSNKEIESIKKGENNAITCENTNEYCILTNKTITNNYKEVKSQNNSSIDSKNEPLNTSVNINKANKEELMTLSGIGESKALKIIEYRTDNGNFKSIEEITKVSGIGSSIYEKNRYIQIRLFNTISWRSRSCRRST